MMIDDDDYVIAIPSYKRVEILKTNTLKMFKEQKVPSHKIYIFVANQEEYDHYKKEIDTALYNDIIIGEKGLLSQLRFIKNYYCENKHILRIDDDVNCVFKKKHSRKDYPSLSTTN